MSRRFIDECEAFALLGDEISEKIGKGLDLVENKLRLPVIGSLFCSIAGSYVVRYSRL